MPILTRNGAELPTLKVYINVDFRAPPESRSSRVATGVEGKSTSLQVYKSTFLTVLLLKINIIYYIYNINFVDFMSKFFSVFCAKS